jgi:hypothetical protein
MYVRFLWLQLRRMLPGVQGRMRTTMDDDTTKADAPESKWCLVGNIVAERPYGEGGLEVRRGTKHFSGGTKVYCMPAQWGDGYDQIMVIGRHRKSKQFKTMIISADWVTNWRARVVYHPEVLRRMAVAVLSEYPWRSQEHVEEYVRILVKR